MSWLKFRIGEFDSKTGLNKDFSAVRVQNVTWVVDVHSAGQHRLGLEARDHHTAIGRLTRLGTNGLGLATHYYALCLFFLSWLVCI